MLTTMPGLTQPLVSIILPTYNGARYLREAIESCLAQTYRNWELIVVDDSSRDATPQIVAEYTAREARIRSIRHPTNQKLPSALNTGHAAAQGSYLTWTSDDNRYLPAALQEMTSFLEDHPAVGMVYADCVLIDDGGRYLRDYPAQPASKLAYMNPLGPCFLYRRSVYERVGGYDSDVFLAEDYEYWLRVYRHFQLAPLHRTLYEYRWHSDSLTNTAAQAAVWASVERALRRHLPHLRNSSRQERARGWIVCAATAARRGDSVPAMNAYARALRTAPGFSVGYVVKKLVERLRPAYARSSTAA